MTEPATHYRDKWESAVDRTLETLGERQMGMRGEVGQIHAELRAVRGDTHRTNDLLESIHRRLDIQNQTIQERLLPDNIHKQVVEDWDEVRLYSFRFGAILKNSLFGSLKWAAIIAAGLLVWAISKGFMS